LDSGFTPVPNSDSRVQEALERINNIFDDSLYDHKIENLYINENGTDLVVRMKIYLRWVEAAENNGPDGSGQDIWKACNVWVEVIRNQIQSWHACEISAQEGEPRPSS
jgi:hypothetical protein